MCTIHIGMGDQGKARRLSGSGPVSCCGPPVIEDERGRRRMSVHVIDKEHCVLLVNALPG